MIVRTFQSRDRGRNRVRLSPDYNGEYTEDILDFVPLGPLVKRLRERFPV